MTDALLRYAHFLSILLLSATLFAENLLLKPQLSAQEIRRLGLLDALYGIAAGMVLLAGLGLWFGGAKGAAFYTHNPVFHAKLGLFMVIGAVSVWPTVFLLKNRRQAQVTVPASVRYCKRLELALLPLLPLLATLMARGIGSA